MVHLAFDNFTLEGKSERGCIWDYVAVYDGNDQFKDVAAEVNVALRKRVSQSSLARRDQWPAERAVDGNTGNLLYPRYECTSTAWEYEPWWKVDLGDTHVISHVTVFNRGDCCGKVGLQCKSKMYNVKNVHFTGRLLRNFMVRIGPFEDILENTPCGDIHRETPSDGEIIDVRCVQPISGRWVSIQLIERTSFLVLCEVQVYAVSGDAATGVIPSTSPPPPIQPPEKFYDHCKDLEIDTVTIPNFYGHRSVEEILTSRQWQEMETQWNDNRLSWNRDKYDNNSKLVVKTADVWIPNIYLQRNGDARFADFPDAPVTITSDGLVTWDIIDILLTTTCDLEPAMFPFDYMECPVCLGAKTDEVFNCRENNSVTEHQADHNRHGKRFKTCGEEDSRQANQWKARWKIDVNVTENKGCINIKFDRIPTFHLCTTLLPAIILSVLMCIIFVLPIEKGDRVSFGMTILLSMVVSLVFITDVLPAKGSMPVAALLVIVYMCMMAFFLIITVIVIRISSSDKDLPPIVKKVFLRYIARLVFLGDLTQTKHGHTELKVDDFEMAEGMTGNNRQVLLPSTHHRKCCFNEPTVPTFNTIEPPFTLKPCEAEEPRELLEVLLSLKESVNNLSDAVETLGTSGQPKTSEATEDEAAMTDYRQLARVLDRLCLILYVSGLLIAYPSNKECIMGRELQGVLACLLFILTGLVMTAADCSSSCYVTSCYCSYQGITSVPQDLPTTITGLNLRGNQITSISQSDFSRYRNLETLNLVDNNISTINSQAFYLLPNLTKLELDSNQITILRDDMFTGLGNLQTLYLYSSEISDIQAGTFSSTPQLTSLYMDYNKLTVLRSGMFTGLGNLETLNIRNNDISDIQAGTFNSKSRLETLGLRHNKLTILRSGMFTGLRNLKLLSLDNNEISDIQTGTFSSTTQLKYLYLNNNKLTGIVSDMFTGLRNVEKIYLQNNDISDIQDDTFSSTPRLINLHLYNNKLTTLRSDMFTGLGNLQELLLYSNIISDIQAGTFSPALRLSSLHLSNNKLTNIRVGMFTGLGDLRYLRLSNNDISDVQAGTFSFTPQLLELYLNDNKLTSIVPDTFTGLKNLQELYLWNNEISDIQAGTFSPVTLSNSHIQSIPSNSSDMLMMTGSHSFENWIICSDPSNFRGQKLKDMNPEDLICKEPNITSFQIISNNSLVQGESLHLVCEALGIPTPDITVTLPSGLNATVESVGRVTVDVNGTITITNVTAADAGLYVCIAENPVGSKLATLLVDVFQTPQTASAFTLPVLLGTIFGSIAGALLLIAAIVMTLWCRRNNNSPPENPDHTVVFNNANNTTYL
ncbi:uncharacterized protein LOC118408715 [Branchiostoma floridae]|uniref:Uncharacterized protein LOC118408715 n=1 Tax=Branchiostoma floridae TaxID=7739 RepID=A0A9J7HTU5_BRAFL|nr:uncharacterized protein LOC118408715 [Branchiostoma floridae]